MIITFGTQKGGAGKTTLAIAFANYIACRTENTVRGYDYDFQKSFYGKWLEDEQEGKFPKLYDVENFDEEIIKNIFKTSTLNNEQQKAAKQIAEITASFSSKLISDPKFMQMLKNVYMQTFTEEEVLANIQFLETPLGQSINKKSSKMMSEIMRNSIAMSAEMMQDPAIQLEMNRQIEKTLTPLFEQAQKAQ